MERDTSEAALLAALDDELRTTPYRPVTAIGRGGMGAVYEVEHRTLKRKLVMKLLREPNRPDLEDRLRLEAQTLAQLAHPNLLQVVDYAKTAAGRPFIVSERLYGKTLKDHVGATGALPAHEAAAFVSQALAGLYVAHRAGVVHRDVKLDNLFLTAGDDLTPPRVVVIDFGIARLVGAEGERAVQVAPLEVPTAEGIMVGTPSFMSPEQVTNQRVDHRADIYGAGVVLYRLLAGRPPFICGDVIEYAAAHATEVPKRPSLYAEVPAALDAIVMKALEKRPADRFQSAKEMIDALAPFTKPAAGAPAARAAAAPPRPEPPPGELEHETTSPMPPRAPSVPRLTPRGTERILEPLPVAPKGTQMMLEPPPRAVLPRATPPRTQVLVEPPPTAPPVHYARPPGPARAEPTLVDPAAGAPSRALEVAALLVALVAAGAIVWFSLKLLGVVP